MGAVVLAMVLAVLGALVVVSSAAAQGLGAPQCSDGQDNDADGQTDFPNDPQCVQNPGDPPGLSSDDSEELAGYQAPSGPTDGGGSGAGPCETTEGPATISDVFAKPAGAQDWEAYKGQCRIEYQEQPDPTGGTMRYLVVSFTTQSGNQDLKSLYPRGTEISFDVSSSGPAPLFVLGTGSDMLADIGGGTTSAGTGGRMTVQGKVPSVEFAFQSGPGGVNCQAGTQQMDFYGVVVQFRSEGGGQVADLMRAYAGAVIGTNAQSVSFGGVRANGSIAVDIDGCGDNLFYEATLPLDGLALGGLTNSLAERLAADLGSDGADVTELTQLADNSQQVPGRQFSSEFMSANEIAPEPIRGAVRRRAASAAARRKVAAVGIDYRTGFSPHDITAAPNKKAVKRAKQAVKECKRGKLRIKRGKLVCKRRR